MTQLPETGFLRLPQIIGEDEITEAQAKANQEHNLRAEAHAKKAGRLDKDGNPIYSHKPTKPKPAKHGLVPVKKSCWWAGVIRALIASA